MSSEPEEINYGKKGGTMGWTAVYLIMFIIMLIWIYNKNFQYLPG